MRNVLEAFKEAYGQYPDALSPLTDSINYPKMVRIPNIPKDAFTGEDFIYSSSGEDYELKYYMELSGNLNIENDYVDGWNTATKGKNSLERGF